MLHFNVMVRIKNTLFCLILSGLMMISSASASFSQEHIRKLDAVRTSMTKMGSSLPELTRKAQPKDIRTMERVFEINNYSLVTIESYFKMIKIALSSGTGINKDVIGVLNGWLAFVTNYCEYDLKYLDEAIAQTKDNSIIEILKTEKMNVISLRDASRQGILENNATSRKL